MNKELPELVKFDVAAFEESISGIKRVRAHGEWAQLRDLIVKIYNNLLSLGKNDNNIIAHVRALTERMNGQEAVNQVVKRKLDNLTERVEKVEAAFAEHEQTPRFRWYDESGDNKVFCGSTDAPTGEEAMDAPFSECPYCGTSILVGQAPHNCKAKSDIMCFPEECPDPELDAYGECKVRSSHGICLYGNKVVPANQPKSGEAWLRVHIDDAGRVVVRKATCTPIGESPLGHIFNFEAVPSDLASDMVSREEYRRLENDFDGAVDDAKESRDDIARLNSVSGAIEVLKGHGASIVEFEGKDNFIDVPGDLWNLGDGDILIAMPAKKEGE